MKSKLKLLVESFLKAIIPIIITALGTFFMTYLDSQKAVIRIGNITTTSNNKYICCMDISNYQSKNIDKLTITIPCNIELSDISTNRYIDIEKIDSNTYLGHESSTFTLNNISSEKQLSFSITTDKEINIDDIQINKNNNKLKILYNKQESNPLTQNLISFIAYIVCFTIFVLISDYTTSKKRLIHNQEIDEKYKEFKKNHDEQIKFIEKRNTELKHKIDNLEIDCKKDAEICLKQKLLLIKQISDYKKELDFWKDTIRKILYTNYNYSKNDANKLFNTITNNLETYSTKYNSEKLDYDNIKIINSIINSKTIE